MKRRILILSGVVSLCAIIVSGVPAHACSCAWPPPCQTPVIFAGRVIDVMPDGFFFVRVRFAVEILFQGPAQEVIEVSSARDGAACGIFSFGPEIGQPWLIYAYGDQDPFGTNICTRTHVLPDPYNPDAVIAEVTGCREDPIELSSLGSPVGLHDPICHL